MDNVATLAPKSSEVSTKVFCVHICVIEAELSLQFCWWIEKDVKMVILSAHYRKCRRASPRAIVLIQVCPKL